MPTKTEPKRPPGRPVLPAEQRRSARFEMRLTPAQRDKLLRLGGSDWILATLDAIPDRAAKG